MRDPDFDIAELERRLASLVLYAKVVAVDAASATVVVESDGWTSGSIPWLAGMAGGADASWDAPVVGERVLVLSPGGERAAAVALRGLYCADLPAPAQDAAVSALQARDGLDLRHDRTASRSRLVLADAGMATLQVGNVEISATDDRVEIRVGSSTVTVEGSRVVVDADVVELGGTGGPGVARIGDYVNPNTNRIEEGSDVVKAV